LSSDIPQFASISGELAPNLWGRTDFQKYDSGWAKAHNWIVDYRGGLFSRFGTEFGDIIEWSEGEAVLYVPFQYSPDTANTYTCIFTDDKVRFVQDNAYVLESVVTVDSLANSTGDRLEITATSHGYSNGDWVKLSAFTVNTSLNTRTVQVANKTTNTFECVDPITGDYVEIASVTTEAAEVYRIYTIASPYGHEAFEQLQAVQIRDYVRLTHPDYPIKNLIRNDTTDWEITNEEIGAVAGTVTGLAKASTTNDENTCYVYMVTAVDENDEEGLPDIIMTINNANLQDFGDGIAINWTAVAGAISYNIYRSRGIKSTSGVDLRTDINIGYIGSAIGVEFVDPGITPDFTQTPPISYNPFANGRIQYVTVSAAGSGYDYDSVISWPAGGSGAYGFLVTQGDGASPIYGVQLFNGGEGYTGTTITAADGTGATLTAALTPAAGNNPRCVALFQQRLLYGATDNNPLRIFGSRVGRLSNFNYTKIGSESDSYEFDLDAPKVSPIRHLRTVTGGLLVFNEIGVWLIYGPNEEIVTGANAKADPQNAVGASYVPPVYLDSFLMYISAAGQEIRMLSYVNEAKSFIGRNVSLLSNHLFKPNLPVKSLTWAEVPTKTLFAVQSNGRLIALTVDIENNVYGATPLWTKGFFRQSLSVTESNESRVYFAVEREIQGNRVMYFERSVSNVNRPQLEDAFCVDAGLELSRTAPTGRLVPSSKTGAVTFTLVGGAPGFKLADEGKILRCGTGKAEIDTYTSASEISGTWLRDLEESYPETDDPAHFETGGWWLDAETSTLTGLWHLEGETVTMLADGTVFSDRTVENGSISVTSLDGEGATIDVSRAAVGLPFTCRALTLPLTAGDVSIEGRRKRIIGTAARLHESYGLKVGPDLTRLKRFHDQANRHGWTTGDPRLRNAMIYEPVQGSWKKDSQVYFVQDSPRPAAILNFIRDVDLGDDKD
jgi:hypothetical protein